MASPSSCYLTWITLSTVLIGILLSTLTISEAYEWPTLTMISTEDDVKHGDSKRFICNTTSEIILLGLTWTFNKEPIAYYYKGHPGMIFADGYSPSEYIVTMNEKHGHASSSLAIKSSNFNQHDGTYCCEFWVMGGYSETQCIENKVSVLPHEVTLYINGKNATDSRFTIDFKKEYTFMISVKGAKPAAEISWSLGGVPVDGHQEDLPNRADRRFSDSYNTLGPITLSELSNLQCSIKIPGDAPIEKYIEFIPEMPLSIQEREIKEINMGVALFLLVVVASLALVIGLICFLVAITCSKTKENGKN